MKNARVHSRYENARKLLIFWCLFIGIGAVAGATGMLAAPDGSALGMDEMLPYFQVLPFADVLFQDFIFAGIALLIVNGITNLVAAALLFCRKKAGVYCGGAFGVTLMLWICIQFIIFPLNFMSTIYFIFGAMQAATGYAALVFYKQERFSVDPAEYPNIGADKSRLVVYFSRMGYTKKAAYERANECGADIAEIKCAERTQGTSGFWWCGRYAMCRWPMPCIMPDVDLSRYESVTICTPIWVFKICAVTRDFCKKASGQIKRADYILTHFQRAGYKNAVLEMDELLGIKHTSALSVCVRAGRRVWQKQI